MLSVIILSANMRVSLLNAVMLRVAMLVAIMLSAALFNGMLIVVKWNAVMLNVMGPTLEDAVTYFC